VRALRPDHSSPGHEPPWAATCPATFRPHNGRRRPARPPIAAQPALCKRAYAVDQP
jgi:hypothetical protein